MTKLFPSLCLVAFLTVSVVAPTASAQQSAPKRTIVVQHVVDGDTLLLSTKTRVRLIGVDTPETHESAKLRRDVQRTKQDAKTIKELGKRSERFVSALMTGRTVRLKYDQHNKTRNNKDRYGRTLAYVYFDPPACEDLDAWLAEEVCELDSYEKGFLNALIIEAGYANAYTSYPFRFREEFPQLERDARQKKRGLWRDPPKGGS